MTTERDARATSTGLVTQQNGRPIFWDDAKGVRHLCEGSQLVAGESSTFCLWTRCGKQDVPANAGWTTDAKVEADCHACRALET